MSDGMAIKQPWKTVRLGDVAKTASGGTPKRSVATYYGGQIPWVKSGELGDSTVYETEEAISQAGLDASSAKVFPKGTLCIALYGATVGKLGILGVAAATNQAVCGIFLPEEIDIRFAYRFLESKRRDLIEMGKGGAQSNISQEIVRDLELPLPPLSEQHRIVAEIEKQFTRLEAGVAALKRVQANLKRYRAAVLKTACEGKLVPTEAELARKERRKYETGAELLARILIERRAKWAESQKTATRKKQYKEPTAPDTSELPPLPDGWIWASVEQLADVGTGATPNRGNRVYYDGGTIPWVTSTAVNEPFVWSAKEYVSDRALAETNLTLYPEGTLLLAMYGEGKTRGKCSELQLAATTNQALAALQCDPLVRPMLKISLAHQYEDVRLKSSGGVQPNLNLSLVRKIVVPLPPLAEQARIVAEVERRLSIVDELEALVSTNLARSTRLRQSILQCAFSGQLVTSELEAKYD